MFPFSFLLACLLEPLYTSYMLWDSSLLLALLIKKKKKNSTRVHTCIYMIQEDEMWVLVYGLRIALEMGIRSLHVEVDSQQVY